MGALTRVDVEPERRPHLCPLREAEARLHDPDDLVNAPVEADRSADNARGRFESLAPEPLGDERDGCGTAGTVVLVGEASSHEGRLSEQGEERRGNEGAIQADGLAFVSQVVAMTLERSHALEGDLSLPPVSVVLRGDGNAIAPQSRLDFFELNEPLGLREVESPEYPGLEPGEDRRVRADAQGEHEDDRERPRSPARQLPKPEPEVLEHGLTIQRARDDWLGP